MRSAQPTPAQHTLMRRPLGAACVDRGGDLRLVGHVAGNERRALSELARQRLALLRVQVGDRHRRAARVQRAGGRLAQPGRASGDECSCFPRVARRGTLHAIGWPAMTKLGREMPFPT